MSGAKWCIAVFLVGLLVGAGLVLVVVYRPATDTIADLRAELAADLETWTERLSELSAGLADSEATVDRLEGCLSAGTRREADYRAELDRRAAEVRRLVDERNAALGRLDDALRVGLGGSEAAEAAIERIADFGDRAATELGISADGVRPEAPAGAERTPSAED